MKRLFPSIPLRAARRAPRVVVLLPLMLVLGQACSSLAVAAATVDGEKITEPEVEAELNVLREDPIFGEALRRDADTRGQRRREILSELIYLRLTEQEATRRKIRVTSEQIDNLIKRSADARGVSVKELLDEENLSESEADKIAERSVRRFALIDVVVDEVDVDEDAVREVYEGQQDRFVDVHLERVKVKDESAAREILEDPDSAEFEDLGYVPVTSLAIEVQGPIAQAVEGSLVDPIPTAAGDMEVYRLIDRRTKEFDEVEGDIRQSLTQEERERRFEEWIIGRVRAVRIVVNPKYGRFDKSAPRPTVVPATPGLRP